MAMGCIDCHDYMDGYNCGKKEGTIEELEKIISFTNNMAKNIIEQGVNPDFNAFGNKDEALALYGFVYIKAIIENRIAELKGE